MNTQRLGILVLFVLAISEAVGAQKPDKPGSKTPADPPVIAGEVGKKLDAAVRAFDATAGGFCGVVLVAAKGKVLLENGYGIADAKAKTPMPVGALYDWASVSKQFTAAAVLRLIEASRGKDSDLAKLKPKGVGDKLKKWRKLSLDDPLSRFFRDAPADKAKVTLRQLLNHTSGIESGFKSEWKFDSRDRESFVKLALSLPMTTKPGEAWDYSNSGYALVAAIIERVTGVTFEQFCDECVFRPAGLRDMTMIGFGILDASKAKNQLARVPKIARGAGFTDRPAEFHFAYGDELTWGYRGSGGVVGTAHDMFLWDRALRDGKFLNKESIAALYQPGLKDYALGWEVTNSGKKVTHSGGVLGVVAYYLRLLDDDIVVALAASYDTKDHPARLAEQLAGIAK